MSISSWCTEKSKAVKSRFIFDDVLYSFSAGLCHCLLLLQNFSILFGFSHIVLACCIKPVLLYLVIHKIKNTTVMIYIVVVFWDFLMFEQIFLSPQMKWRMIMSNKHGIYQLPDELPNNLRLKSYGIRKYQEN